MVSQTDQEFDERLEGLLQQLPRPVSATVRWLQRPDMRWPRIGIGVAMIIFGFLGFLPILGFWMIPLGAFLLAQDFPPMRRFSLWTLDQGARLRKAWQRWRGRR
jgi:4-alpha-glucanotransferase